MIASFFNSLFKSNTEKRVKAPPAEFSTYASTAIHLLKTSSDQLTDEQAIELFTVNGLPRAEAEELLTFLPIAFCRNLLTVIKWPDYYLDQVSKNQFVSIKYNDNQRFTAIQTLLTPDFTSGFSRDELIKIAGRSASFQAINSLLLANPGGKLEGLIMTPEHILH